MRVRIREKISSDIDKIITIVKGLPEWFTPNAISEIIEDSKKWPGFVVEADNVVRGFILLEERECCVEIAWLAVERGFHARGLGSLLMVEAERYACRIGKPILTVKTYGGEDYGPYMKAIKFYKGRGFKLYEIIKNYQPFGGQPAAVLMKLLRCQNNMDRDIR